MIKLCSKTKPKGTSQTRQRNDNSYYLVFFNQHRLMSAFAAFNY